MLLEESAAHTYVDPLSLKAFVTFVCFVVKNMDSLSHCS